METIIIMTEVKSPWGKYTKFTKKGSGKILAEVDRKTKKDFGWAGYVVYGGSNQLSEMGRHSKKDVALEFAKEYIRGFIPGAVFKWNVMSERIKFVA